MKPLIIYHGDCNDGFGAALAAYLYYGDHAEYFAGMYDGKVPNVTNRDVLIFDYHFKYEILTEMKKKAKSLILKDHHVTVMNSLSNLDYAIFDVNKCGAMLAWEHFFNEDPPEMFLWLQDRDLYLNKYPESNAFYYYLNSQPYDLTIWKNIFNQLKDPIERNNILKTGQQIYQFYLAQMELILKHHARKIVVDNVEGWILNTNRMFATEAGHILAKRTGTFAIIWSINEKNTVGCSVRSVGSYTAKMIAEKRGGGGHEHAAKFRMNIEDFTKEFLK